VFSEAFHLRKATADREQEKYLSAIYYEYFDGEHPARMKACCGALAFKPKAKDGLIRMQARAVKEQGKKRDLSLRVTHEPKDHSPAYAAIRGIPIETDDELSDLLATVAVLEVIEVSSLG